jgi:hypothetical protein
MPALSTLLDRVHDEIPGVPEPLALRALSDAVGEFCKRTHCWQEDLADITTEPDVSVYELDASNRLVVAIKEVRLDGVRVEPYPVELKQLLSMRLSAADKPVGWTQISTGQLELLNTTLDEQTLEVTAALSLKQGDTTTDIPQDLVDEYASALAAGAKSKLVMQPGQAWFNPDVAVIYGGTFYRAVNEAKRRVMGALGAASLSVEMRRW